MASFRAVVHYHFKRGMEEEGIKFLENELVKKAREYGCHAIELWQHGKDSSNLIGIGYWNSLDEARKFQSIWEAKEKEFMRYCRGAPKREFYQVRSISTEQHKRVA